MKIKISRLLFKTRYFIAIIVFGIFIGFVGDHCLIKRIQQKSEIATLKSKIAAERMKFEEDSLSLVALTTDDDAVRKIARERYFMKNNGEDVFMINDADLIDDED